MQLWKFVDVAESILEFAQRARELRAAFLVLQHTQIRAEHTHKLEKTWLLGPRKHRYFMRRRHLAILYSKHCYCTGATSCSISLLAHAFESLGARKCCCDTASEPLGARKDCFLFHTQASLGTQYHCSNLPLSHLVTWRYHCSGKHNYFTHRRNLTLIVTVRARL